MKVLIAIDQSPFADQILENVLNSHWPKDTSFKVLTVVEPFQWQNSTGESMSPEWKSIAQEVFQTRLSHAGQILQNFRQKLESGIPYCTAHTELLEGKPGDEIIAAAAKFMADKIIVGGHGSAPNRLLGRVPQAVAREASCSVQIVRLKEPEDALKQAATTGKKSSKKRDQVAGLSK
ncbi:MAG: universal stress protein [Candidatus Obscuribacterales bacterium]|nr:universal stress protein [Candidatus Obscuribacterales bacterium]